MSETVRPAPARSGAAGASPLVVLRNVGKRFANGTIAVKACTLAIPEHSFISLLGPSGCGKSTVLRMIAGLAEPSIGQLEWGDAGGGASGRRGRTVSFVFQEPTLLPWATALRNVMMPLMLAHVPKREARARAEEALSRVGHESAAARDR